MSFIILQCLSILSAANIFLIWLGVFLLSIGLLYSLVKNCRAVLKTNKDIKNLPLKDYGLGAILINDMSNLAFTAGLLRPKIYISKGLFNSLTNDEIRAVFLHELHHKKKYDPLKFFISSFVKDMFFYVPITKYLAGLLHIIKEKAADDKVVSITGKPFELASAIVKISANNSLQMSASIKGMGQIENRIKRLVGEENGRIELPPIRTILTSLLMVFFLLSLPVVSVYGFDKRCDDNKCRTTHHHKNGNVCEPNTKDMDCNKHCYMNKSM